MLELIKEGVGPKIKGNLHIASCYQVGDGKWICHPKKGDNTIKFVYSYGLLSVSMAQREMDLDKNLQMIAINKDLDKLGKDEDNVKLKDILSILEWECDDYLD